MFSIGSSTLFLRSHLVCVSFFFISIQLSTLVSFRRFFPRTSAPVLFFFFESSRSLHFPGPRQRKRQRSLKLPLNDYRSREDATDLHNTRVAFLNWRPFTFYFNRGNRSNRLMELNAHRAAAAAAIL